MTDHMMPAELAGAERHTWQVGADRARKAYRTKHGANVTLTLDERRAWNAEHGAAMAAAAMRSGVAAVRRMHTARVHEAAEMCDPSRIGGPARGAYRERIQAAAVASEERLAALASVGKAPRKAAARKPAKGKNFEIAPVELADPSEKILVPETVTCPQCGSVNDRADEMCDQCARPIVADDVTAPETVPAPMPRMTRAARKATRREIAASMRAAGVKPEGQAWIDACRAAGLVSVAAETVDA